MIGRERKGKPKNSGYTLRASRPMMTHTRMISDPSPLKPVSCLSISPLNPLAPVQPTPEEQSTNQKQIASQLASILLFYLYF
jgi:hypothetical protein